MEDLSKYNREGSVLRRVQNQMLTNLKIVADICDKHNISYWLEGGTLLGAVRHKGFIPWDDDLDICVLRKDMKRLKKYLQKELPKDYIYLDRFTNWSYPRLYSKVYYDKSSLVESNSNGVHYGVFIDIFPVEPVFFQKTKVILDFIYRIPVKGLHGCFGKSEYIKIISGIFYIPVRLLVSVVRGMAFLFRRKKMYALPYGKTAYNTVPAKYIFPLKKMCFESQEFYVPQNPDKYLRRLFGDYMVIPPEGERMTHAIDIRFDD